MSGEEQMARLFNNVLVTGGAGYCGARLVPQLLDHGYKVTVFDILYFGDSFLPKNNPNLKVLRGDIRDTKACAAAVAGNDAVVNLACISNDASFELDEKLSTSINLDAFEPLVMAAKAAGVKRFIYASSSSVYGVSDEPNVTEDHPLVPLTLYNKYKGMCEPLLKKHTDDVHRRHLPARRLCAAIRPASASTCPSTSLPIMPSPTARLLYSAARNCGRTCTSRTTATP
jgi:nucleoside-diphosphate-sugar epimerase